MFGLEDIMKNVDLGDILEKVGLSDSDKKGVTNQAADAVKYRVNKETARGNKGMVESLFSQKENTEDANVVAKKLEGDLAFNLKKKSNLSDTVIDQIKSAVMSKFLGGLGEAGKEKGDKEGKGMLDSFMDSDMVDGFKDKLGGLGKFF
jgi:hypothetical protein